MGNNASLTIGVCTDAIIYATGSTVTGRVYLSVNSEEGIKASALPLTLSGVEMEQQVETKSGQDSSPHEVMLEIPHTAHETYNGKHINIKHKLMLQLDSGILSLARPSLKSTPLVNIKRCPRDPATAIAEFIRNEGLKRHQMIFFPRTGVPKRRTWCLFPLQKLLRLCS